MKKKGEKKIFSEKSFWIIIFQAPKSRFAKKNSIFTNHQFEVEGGGVQISFARTLPYYDLCFIPENDDGRYRNFGFEKIADGLIHRQSLKVS